MQSLSAIQLSLEYPVAIFPTRLEWLCQPEQIEHTLCLIFYLNVWKKAFQRLLYADRQGLCEAQACVLEQATRVGIVQPIGYLDGTYRFPSELLLESVAEKSARGILVHLHGLDDPQIWPPFHPEGDRLYQHFIRPLYKRITGQDFKLVKHAAEALDCARVSEYIQERLRRLVERARATRQPIPTRRLAALCVTPSDLLHIRDNRVYYLDSYESWEDLDISDQRKLDPEGYSEVVFGYTSPTADFVFHLPLRWAELFLSNERLRVLQRVPVISQERGIYQGRPIDEQESLQHPAKEILQDLGIDIGRICPHKLLDKETYLASPSIRNIRWPTWRYAHEDWENDPWDGISLPHAML